MKKLVIRINNKILKQQAEHHQTEAFSLDDAEVVVMPMALPQEAHCSPWKDFANKGKSWSPEAEDHMAFAEQLIRGWGKKREKSLS